MIVLPLLGYSFLVIFELVPLYKQKNFRDFWLNIGLSFCSFVVAVILSFGIIIPSPAGPIQKLIESLFGK